MAYVIDIVDDDDEREIVSSGPFFLYFISAGNHVQFPWVDEKEKDAILLSCDSSLLLRCLLVDSFQDCVSFADRNSTA